MKGFNPEVEKNYAQKAFTHLEGGVKPIIVSLNVIYKTDLETQNTISDIVIGGERIDYDTSIKYRNENNIAHFDQHEYVISAVNENNKYSENYYRCLGLFAIGTHAKTGKNISLLMHEDPYFTSNDILAPERENFLLDLQMRLKQLKEICKPKTIDAIMYGGNQYNLQNYPDSLKDIADASKLELGFTPTIVVEPSGDWLPTCVYCDTANRRMYFVQARQTDNNLQHPKDFKSVYKKYK